MQTKILHCAAMERHERLKWARQRRGFETAADAAEFLGVPYGTYSGHEAGSRGIKDGDLIRYARAFRVPAGWLAFEEGSPERGPVRVVGIAGSDPDGAVTFTDQVTPNVAPLIPGATNVTVALLVRGHFMRGIADDGWLIYYDDRKEPPTDELFGELCVVGLSDGRVLVKILERGREEGRFDLESFTSPTLRDQKIEWAALVISLVPRGAAKRFTRQTAA